MDSAPKLGIFEGVPAGSGRNPSDAIRDILRFAELVDALGYHRYRLAEHPGAGATPAHARPSELRLVRPTVTDDCTLSDRWLLGADTESASVAASLGLPFSYAHFLAPGDAARVLRTYAAAFVPSARQPGPRTSLVVSVLCHERASVARRQFDRDAVYRARLALGARPVYPDLDDVAREQFSDQELALVEDELRRTIVGAPIRLRERLLDLAAEHGVDELVLCSASLNPEVRERTFTLIAQAFQLTGAAGQAA